VAWAKWIIVCVYTLIGADPFGGKAKLVHLAKATVL
jgi:hypothetical protein